MTFYWNLNTATGGQWPLTAARVDVDGNGQPDINSIDALYQAACPVAKRTPGLPPPTTPEPPARCDQLVPESFDFLSLRAVLDANDPRTKTLVDQGRFSGIDDQLDPNPVP
jgi:hypothetical protein